MYKKYAVLVGMGDYYGDNSTGFDSLPFVYKNVDELSAMLDGAGWTVYPAILDGLATEEKIMSYLFEKIEQLEKNDWLLLYYAGHGELKNGREMFLVNAAKDFKYNLQMPYNDFLFDFEYKKVIDQFKKFSPKGHLITVLDCCYAFGLIDSFDDEQDFHTILAASQANEQSYYSSNSFFFQALKKSWDASNFLELKDNIEDNITRLYRYSECQIRIAKNFQSSTI
jgi:hypothetical protein